MIGLILEYLAALVACDTQNPPRQITPRSPLYKFLDSVCGRDFQVKVWDHGDGRISYFARRGDPWVLFNVHLDTVPAGAGWMSDPFRLEIENNRAIGLGACDIKGAAACLLALAHQTDVDLALLFTTDEEGSDPCCIRRFFGSWGGGLPSLTVVAEPTGSRVVYGHRGYVSQRGTFHGRSSHTSIPKSQRSSAVHQLVEWSAGALRWVNEAEAAVGSEVDFCFNLGTVEGGIKNNMVADRAEVCWSARLPAEHDTRAMLSALESLPSGTTAEWQTTFFGLAFPNSFNLREKAKQFVSRLALPTAPDVDFWTEASVFSDGHWPAIVLGPGDIAQAHSAGEWVALDQLELAFDHYSRIAHVD